MALEGVGRYYKAGRSMVVRVPVDVVRDSTFPLKNGERVIVRIVDGDRLIVNPEKRLRQIDDIPK
jgi:RNase P/RNase MRP subunit p29